MNEQTKQDILVWAGIGLVIDGKLCDCRACYAGSVGLTPSAVDNWHGRRKCRHNK